MPRSEKSIRTGHCVQMRGSKHVERLRNHLGWNADGGCAVRDVTEHKGKRADFAIVPDRDAAQNLRIGAEFHVITDFRDRPVVVPVSDGNALTKCAVGTDDGVGMDDDPPEMPDPQARANVRRNRQADACRRFDQAVQEPVDFESNALADAFRLLQETAPPAVNPDRPDRLFPQERAGGIALKVGLPGGIIAHR